MSIISYVHVSPSLEGCYVVVSWLLKSVMLQVEDLKESDLDLKLILEMYRCESIDSRSEYHTAQFADFISCFQLFMNFLKIFQVFKSCCCVHKIIF